MRIEEVTQIAKPTLSPDDTIERIEHHFIARLIEEQLHAYIFRTLHINQLSIVRHRHHHPVTSHIADGSRKVEVLDLVLAIHTEEGHRSAELEIMFNLLVTLPEHLHHELVQRVIVALPHLQRIPGITTLHLPLQSHLLGLLTERLFLSGILHLEQQFLLG